MNKKLFIFTLIIIIFVGVTVYFTALRPEVPPSSINTFKKCVSAGYPVLESYPRQCKTPDNKTFAEDIGNERETREIKLYYYNEKRDREIAEYIPCDPEAVLPVSREIFFSQTPIQDAINLLLQGMITQEEKEAGFSLMFPLEGVKLVGANLRDGVLTLEFEDPFNKTGGGSCRVRLLWAQIEKTAKQFPEVQRVRFLPEELFQP